MIETFRLLTPSRLNWLKEACSLHFFNLKTRHPKSETPIELWIKKDGDLGLNAQRETGIDFIYGGNKLRKLEYILPAVIAKGAHSISTVGGEGSHHVLASIIAAKQLGLTSHVLLTPQKHSSHSQIVYRTITRLATSVTVEEQETSHELKKQIGRWQDRINKVHGESYFIPTGGSSILGTFGMIDAVFELVSQMEEKFGQSNSQTDLYAEKSFDDCVSSVPLETLSALYIPTASGSSLAGLLLGFALAWPKIWKVPQIYAVKVGPKQLISRKKVLKLYQGCLQKLMQTQQQISSFQQKQTQCLSILRQRLHQANHHVPRFTILGDYLGQGYAEPTDKCMAVQTWAQPYEIILDPTYTSKAFAALVDQEFPNSLSKLSLETQTHILSAPNQSKKKRILFWHTLDERPLNSLPN